MYPHLVLPHPLYHRQCEFCAPWESRNTDLRREIDWLSYDSFAAKIVPSSGNLTFPWSIGKSSGAPESCLQRQVRSSNIEWTLPKVLLLNGGNSGKRCRQLHANGR